MPLISDATISACNILIVDDDAANTDLLESILETNGFSQYRTLRDPGAVLQVCGEFPPDLILLDLHMSHMDGVEVLKNLRALREAQEYLPALVLTADVTAEAKKRALTAGASDFLAKPLDATEAILRIRSLLTTRILYLQILTHNTALDARVTERAEQFVEAQREILERLAAAAEYRDDNTGQHTRRVGQLAALLARALGQSEEEIERFRLAAALHDIGKIGVPDHVFLKPGGLTRPEFEIMQSHTTIGAEILNESRFSVLQVAREIALCHHERWDGTGYPRGLSGDRIPLSARIVSIADTFDAITHDRLYRKARPLNAAVAEMKSQSGLQFDPTLLKTFFDLTTSNDLEKLWQGIEGTSESWIETSKF
jgi:putative two-component system response regulator